MDHKARAQHIKQILHRWRATSVAEPRDGLFTFDLHRISGVAYALQTEIATLRCSLFIDQWVDKEEADEWVDLNDDAPFGGLTVFRDQEIPRRPGGPLPGDFEDEFALRFVCQLPFDSRRVAEVPLLATSYFRRWHWRYVQVPRDAAQAVVETTTIGEQPTTYRCRWFTDPDERRAYTTARITELNAATSRLEKADTTVFLAEFVSIDTLELGRLKVFAGTSQSTRFLRAATDEPWLLLPEDPEDAAVSGGPRP